MSSTSSHAPQPIRNVVYLVKFIQGKSVTTEGKIRRQVHSTERENVEEEDENMIKITTPRKKSTRLSISKRRNSIDEEMKKDLTVSRKDRKKSKSLVHTKYLYV